ncbi:unnamed protein product [Callosobruchus maculatus]|uniref:Uncharacterized protein n=1 Tax=Callosobruchus maculatus TaxID=64391 RepID=A0A653C0R4_CALMS|nr:unnamed protein product [Callosobruchus maculatus]
MPLINAHHQFNGASSGNSHTAIEAAEVVLRPTVGALSNIETYFYLLSTIRSGLFGILS